MQDKAPTLRPDQLAELDAEFQATRDDLDAKKKTLKGLTAGAPWSVCFGKQSLTTRRRSESTAVGSQDWRPSR